jgi:hypothetical protein
VEYEVPPAPMMPRIEPCPIRTQAYAIQCPNPTRMHHASHGAAKPDHLAVGSQLRWYPPNTYTTVIAPSPYGHTMYSDQMTVVNVNGTAPMTGNGDVCQRYSDDLSTNATSRPHFSPEKAQPAPKVNFLMQKNIDYDTPMHYPSTPLQAPKLGETITEMKNHQYDKDPSRNRSSASLPDPVEASFAAEESPLSHVIPGTSYISEILPQFEGPSYNDTLTNGGRSPKAGADTHTFMSNLMHILNEQMVYEEETPPHTPSHPPPPSRTLNHQTTQTMSPPPQPAEPLRITGDTQSGAGESVHHVDVTFSELLSPIPIRYGSIPAVEPSAADVSDRPSIVVSAPSPPQHGVRFSEFTSYRNPSIGHLAEDEEHEEEELVTAQTGPSTAVPRPSWVPVGPHRDSRMSVVDLSQKSLVGLDRENAMSVHDISRHLPFSGHPSAHHGEHTTDGFNFRPPQPSRLPKYRPTSPYSFADRHSRKLETTTTQRRHSSVDSSLTPTSSFRVVEGDTPFGNFTFPRQSMIYDGDSRMSVVDLSSKKLVPYDRDHGMSVHELPISLHFNRPSGHPSRFADIRTSVVGLSGPKSLRDLEATKQTSRMSAQYISSFHFSHDQRTSYAL